MAEYIEKQALIEGMVKVDGRKWSTKTLGEVLDTIRSIEIVRCKDCRYFEESRNGWGTCTSVVEILIHGTDFCSFGEREEDEDN